MFSRVTMHPIPGLVAVLAVLLGTLSAVTATPAQAVPLGSPARFVALQPERILDTRSGVGAARASVPAGGTVDLTVAGRGGVPASGATAIVLNVTITNTSGSGHVSAYPTGTDGRHTSVIGHTQATPIISGLVTTGLGSNGQVTLYTARGGHLIADVLGYYSASGATAAGRFVPLTPNRTLDTRDLGPRPGAGTSVPLQATGRGGVPTSGVSAVALNITATAVDRAGYVQVVPTGGSTAIGASSNIGTSSRGQTVANLVIVPVGPDGQVTLFTSQAAHLIADVAGYFTDGTAPTSTAGLFQALEPERELDTRTPSEHSGTTGQRPARGSETRIDTTHRRSLPSTGVAAVALGVTAVGPEGDGFVQVFPTGRAAHGSSANIGYSRGQVIANAVLAPLGADGQISLYVSTSTHLIADVFGYYLSGDAPTGQDPLDGLVIAPENTTVAYDRDEWDHWIDADGDCQDTRAEVLIVESLDPVTFTSSARCTVASGRWLDPYSGRTWTLASDVDIDHFVPLRNAHVSGGHAWDAVRKRAFANDLTEPEHLVAVEDNLNQAKGASGPEEWKPPLTSYWCAYALDWSEVKKRWTLTVTQAEHDALRDMINTCPGPTPSASATAAPTTSPSTSPGASPSASPTASATRSPTASPVPFPTAGARLAELGGTRDCGASSARRQAQDWFEHSSPHDGDVAQLDADGGLLACASLPGAPRSSARRLAATAGSSARSGRS